MGVGHCSVETGAAGARQRLTEGRLALDTILVGRLLVQTAVDTDAADSHNGALILGWSLRELACHVSVSTVQHILSRWEPGVEYRSRKSCLAWLSGDSVPAVGYLPSVSRCRLPAVGYLPSVVCYHEREMPLRIPLRNCCLVWRDQRVKRLGQEHADLSQSLPLSLSSSVFVRTHEDQMDWMQV